MAKNWWFKFDYRVWRTDSSVRRCSLETRGFWLELLCAMYESETCEISGSYEEIGWLVGCDPSIVARCLVELQRTKTADVTLGNGSVTVVSRRLRNELKVKKQTNLRVQRHRSNANVTQVQHDIVISKSKSNTHKSETGVCESASRQEEEETGTDAEYSDFRHSLTDWYEDALDADSLPPGSVADRDVRYLFANHFTLAEISEYYETAKHDQWRKGPVTISAIAKGIAHWRSGQTTTAAPERPDFSNCPLGCDPDTGLIYVSDNGHSGMKRCTHKPEQENQQNAEIRS